MRLDKVTIGSPKDSPTHRFKNLKDVTIDFDQNHWITVVIGWNGTGKSNVLEALTIIFRDLIQGNRKPNFAYDLTYQMGSSEDTLYINVDADPDRVGEPLIIHVANEDEARGDGTLTPFMEGEPEISPLRGKKISLKAFFDEPSRHLPHYVFGYYSGESERLHEVFKPYLEGFDRQLRQGKDPGLKRLFYALPVHSQFVLLAFLIQQSNDVRDFLTDHLGIDPEEGIESVLFVLRQPPWKSKEGDPRFWYAKGVVADFLGRLQDIALAPIETSRLVPVSLWNNKTLEFKYLFVKDIASLKQLVGAQRPAEFFRDLESTHVSQLIEEVRIRVRLKGDDGTVTFRELSEGEQQLFTVLGLLRFTAESESLFLLDEPDTHLNPRWAVDYLGYLRRFARQEGGERDDSHILLTTHNPMSIAELVKEQVQILRLSKSEEGRQIIAVHPEFDPRGLGYAAIVTSDMFGIASTLDQPTQELLEQQRMYAGFQQLTEDQQAALDVINEKLDRLGFRFFHPDAEYSRYLRVRGSLLRKRFETDDIASLVDKTVSLTNSEREEIATKLISELLEAKASEIEADN
ncbi:chromosome segregation protein SMC [Phaeobacter inhibens]|uniref:ATP-binding protein n=1 Tax=Phaeobacter inhibens TaxID=221822 RepID=UPI0009717E2A|nr:ATP-binding protein [Phaeobacter inhibens]APX16611.1 chromosome segregation protein SMC [Phaeobacter inhibens]